MILTREALLAREDRPITRVKVGTDEVCVRAMSAREEIALAAEREKYKGDQISLVALGLAAMICDEAGNRILSFEDAEKLLDKKSDLMHAVVSAGHDLAGGDDLKGN